MVYQAHRNRSRLVRFDRAGKELGAIGKQEAYFSLRASPDFRELLTSAVDPRFGTNQLWLFDFERGVETRLTDDRRQALAGPWGPGQRTLVFSASTGQAPHLHERDLATGANRALLPSGPYSLAGDFTPDGKQLLFFQRTARSNWELMTMTMGPTPTTAPLRLSSPSAKLDPRLSRDGQVLSFVSLESGSAELFVSPFPPTGKTIQVSTMAGGRVDGATTDVSSSTFPPTAS
jgi:Tol biopolymer transport system component